MEWHWWLIIVLSAPMIWFAFKVFLTFVLPHSLTGKALLMQKLKAKGIGAESLPDDFYRDCIDFAEKVARFQAMGSKVREKEAIVENLEIIAVMAEQWLRDQSDPSFQPMGGSPNPYRVIFERHGLGM